MFKSKKKYFGLLQGINTMQLFVLLDRVKTYPGTEVLDIQFIAPTQCFVIFTEKVFVYNDFYTKQQKKEFITLFTDTTFF